MDYGAAFSKTAVAVTPGARQLPPGALKRMAPPDASIERATKKTFFNYGANLEVSKDVFIAPVKGTSWIYEIPEGAALFEDMERGKQRNAASKNRIMLPPECVNHLMYNDAIKAMRDHKDKHKNLDAYDWRNPAISQRWKLIGVIATPPPIGDNTHKRGTPRLIKKLLRYEGPCIDYWGGSGRGGRYLLFFVKYVSVGLYMDEIKFNTALGLGIKSEDTSWMQPADRKLAYVPQLYAISSDSPALTPKEKSFIGPDGEREEGDNIHFYGLCEMSYENDRLTPTTHHSEMRDINLSASRRRLNAQLQIEF